MMRVKSAKQTKVGALGKPRFGLFHLVQQRLLKYLANEWARQNTPSG